MKPATCADFITLAKFMGAGDPMFYQAPAGGAATFGAITFAPDREIVISYGQSATPSTFNADFPDALLLAALPTWQPANGQMI
jgi:hypothetical protein